MQCVYVCGCACVLPVPVCMRGCVGALSKKKGIVSVCGVGGGIITYPKGNVLLDWLQKTFCPRYEK